MTTSAITLADTTLTIGETTTVTFRFNEAVANLVSTDIDLSKANGTLGLLSSTDGGRAWTAAFTPAADVQRGTDNTIRVLRSGIDNTPSAAYTVDTVKPTITSITIADNKLSAGEATTITITFSEALNQSSFTLAPIVNRDLQDLNVVDANATLPLVNGSRGTLSNLRTTDDGKTWTVTLTAPTIGNTTDNSLAVVLDTLTDLAGNTGGGGNLNGRTVGGAHIARNLYAIDTTRPTLTSASISYAAGETDTILKAGETATVRFVFSEEVTGFGINDITLSNATGGGTLSGLTLDTTDPSRKTWTATLTAPTTSTGSTNNTLSVNLAGINDLAGNAGTGTATTTIRYGVDTTRPTATITLADTALTVGETTTVTFTFSEPVNGFTAEDIVLTNANGTLGTLTANAARTVWTATFTPTANVNDASNTISVNMTGVSDDAGNAGVGSASSANYTVNTGPADTTRPTATITLADTALTAGETTTVTFTFSEPVNGFTAEDIVLSNANGTLGTLTPNTARTVWSATFTPTANVNDTSNTIGVNLTGVTDGAGNAGVGSASSANFSVDTVRPSVRSVTLADSNLSGNESTTVTIVFSEALNRSLPSTDSKAFTLSDLTINPASSGGIFSDLRTNDGITWQCTLTAPPAVGLSTTGNRIQVNLSGVTDLAGNQGEGTPSFASFSYDLVRPTVTITLADTTLTAGETTTVTFTFSEPVTGFAAEDIVLSNANGTLGTLTANTARTVWTATFTPTANVNDATNTISVNLTGVTDTAGNRGVGSASSANYTVDTTRPTATITLSDNALTSNEVTTVTFTFSEPVHGFTANDIDLSNASGTLGTLRANNASRTVWTATFTPTADIKDATNTIGVNMAGVSDDAGNAGVGRSTSANFTIDTQGGEPRPRITIWMDDHNLTAGETTKVYFRFPNGVTGFTADDIDLSDANGTLGPLVYERHSDQWYAIFTPTANVNDNTNTIRVNLAGLTVYNGHPGSGFASSRSNYTVNTVPTGTRLLTVTITLADTELTAGETTTVTFTFSDPVSGFTTEDIDLSNANGTLGTLRPNAARTVWTATFTPTANVNDITNTIKVNLTGIVDDAGKAGTGSATSANYLLSTTTAAPLRITITLDDSTLTSGESTTVTFTFSKPFTGFTSKDIDLSNTAGWLGPLTANADYTVWTTIFTPTVNHSDTSNTISVHGATSANFTVFTPTNPPPARIWLSTTTGDSHRSVTVVTFDFDHPVTNFDIDDIDLSNANGTLDTLRPDGVYKDRVWTAIFTPAADIQGRSSFISVNLAGITTALGSPGAGRISSDRYTFDTARPTATVTLADTALTAGETTTVTFTFSEPVNGLTADDIVLSNANGTLGALTPNAARTVWTATFTPTANVWDATNTISVSMNGVSDAAGNAGVGRATSANYTVNTRPADTTAPTATITISDTRLKAGDTPTVTFTFDKAVMLTDRDIDLSRANGTLGTLTSNAADTVWTAVFTPTTDIEATDNIISVMNIGGSSQSHQAYRIDTKRPEIILLNLSDDRITTGESPLLTITFSEPVNGFTADNIDLSRANGTLGPLTANADRTVWTATFTPRADFWNVQGDQRNYGNTIRVNMTGVRDDAGNAGVGSAHSSVEFSINTTYTGVAVTLADTALTAGETTTVTFTFTGPVNGFTADAIDLSNANGTLGALTANASRTAWTATFTPTANTNDITNTISVSMRYVTNDIGVYSMGGATSANFTVNTGPADTTAPTATVTLADTALTAGKTTTVTFTFSEPVTGFTADDIVLSNANGTLGALTPNAARTVWTATFTPTANVSDATNTISVSMTGVSDAAGNAGVGSVSSANYTVNTSPVDTTVTLADTALTVGETTTVTFTFSEPVNGFTAADVDLSNANGTLGTLTANAARTVWTATFTPTANVNDASNTISVNLTGVSDDAGNAGVGRATSANYTVNTRPDTTRPTATITLADTALTAGETTTVTFTFSESVTGFTADDIVLSNANGTLGTLTANTARTVWSATFTPTANVNDATNTISVNMTGVSDDAGNAGVGSASSANYTVDTTRPTATITLADSTLTVGETTTVTFTFSEPVNGFTADDILLPYTNDTLGALTANAARTVWTATYTPAANVSSRINTIRVNTTGITDDAGNTGTSMATSANYIIDTTRPTATITLADTALKAGETATVTFTFNERVNGFTADDIVLTDANGTLGALTPVGTDGSTWSATFTPSADIENASNTIGVNLAGVTNTAGNAGVGNASSAHYSIDTKKPMVTSATIADNNLAAGESTTVTITFSEKIDPNSFTINEGDSDDSSLSLASYVPYGEFESRGALSNLRTIDGGTTWWVTLTGPTSGSTIESTIAVNHHRITDLAGNQGGGGLAVDAEGWEGFRSTTYRTDAEPPTATVTLADTALTAGETTTVTVTFSEPVTGFTAEDIVLSNANGTLGTLTTNAERTVWTATFTPTANVNDASNTISVNLTGVTDDAGNAGVGSASSANYTVDTRPDTTRPTATVTLADSSLTAGETTTVTFTFSESVTGFTADDIVLSNANGTLGTLTANTARTVWSATFTPTANVNDATNTISVNMTGVSDDAGNAGVGSASSANYTVDTTRPTATITLADSTLTVGETTTVTFTFSEPVNGFTADDILLPYTNDTLGALTANAARTVWTATYTPAANVSSRINTIRVNTTGITDDAGNTGTSMATSANYIIDTTRPTATITLADTALTAGETTTVTFTFSEPVNGFTTDDIVLSNANGTLGTLTATADRTVWSATFTPTANVNDTSNTISVNMTGVSDQAGNAGVGSASSANYTVNTRSADTTAPTATITLADTALTAGETTTVTFTFSEPVTGFTADDIVLSNANGTLGTLTANADRTVWTATFTPTAKVNDITNTISVNLTGVTDDAGNAGVGSASSANYTVNTGSADTTAPTATITLADTALTAGETTTVTVTFSEPVTGFTAADIVLSNANGTLGTLTPNTARTVWTATFTPTANVNDASNTISVNLTGVTDGAGNLGVGSATSANYTIDTAVLRPRATITLADTALKAGETTTVTFTFNERVNGFTADDIVLTDANGTLGALTPVSTDGTTWTATFTPTADIEDSSNTIGVNLAGVTNTAGNAGVGNASSAHYSIDTKKPMVTSATIADNNLAAGESTTVTITFSEKIDPNSFTINEGDSDDSSLSLASYVPYGEFESRGALSNLRTIDGGTTWWVTLTGPTSGSTIESTIAVNHHRITDLAGNQGGGGLAVDAEGWEGFRSTTYRTDAEPPTATVTLADTALTAGETTTVTVTFSEPVTGFTAEDIVLSNANGTLGTLTTNAERTVWTATFTPTANVNDASNTISVNLTGVTDDAGNAGVGSASSANYTVDTRPDTTRPTATVTLADSSLTAGETTTVTFTFSEPVTGFTAEDIVLSNANGTLGTLTANAARTVWSATFTPTANVNDASNTISVNLTGVSDAAGNAGVGSASSANYTVDTTATVRRPGATIELADTNLKAGETTTVTFTFSEPVTGFTLDDVVLSRANGSLGPLMNLSGDGSIWYATFTAAGNNVHDTRSTISVNLAGVTNAAGSAGQGNASSASYSVDAVRPAASITLADSTLTAGETTTVTITFSERVTGFTRSNLVLDNAHGELGELVAGADGRTWSATFTPRANVERSASSIGLNLSGITDAAGNPAQGPANAGFTVDTMPPKATVTLASSALKAGQSTTVTFTFSESVTGFTAEDIVLGEANGSLGPLSSNADGSVWSATFTPNADTSDASNRIRVNLAGVTDRAGNVGLGFADSANYTVDTVRPGATITLADNTLGAGEVTTVSFLFDKPVTGFTLEDIDLSNANGSLSGLRSSGDGRLWHAEFTPAANTEDASNTIRVNLAGVSDAAGNTGVGSASSANYRIDSVRPTVAITLADSSLTAGETTTVTFRFSEPVSDFNAGDIVLSEANGYLGPLSAAADGKTWTAIFTPRDNLNDATNTIGVNLAGVSDAAGNRGQGLASSANYRLDTRAGDTTAPTATITLSDRELKAGETSTVTIAFSEPVTGLSSEDFVLDNADGRLDQLTLGADGKTWSAIFTPTANIRDTSNSIGLKLSGVRDLAGNAGVGNASSANFSIDTVRPTVSITLAETSLRAGQSTSVTFRFSEAVSGFTAEDIVLSQADGSLGALSPAADGRSWSATFTPTADSHSAGRHIGVNLAGVSNAAGNAGIGRTDSASYSVDTVRPTASITLADTELAAGQSTSVTFSFSESVTGFSSEDIVLSEANGTLGALTANADGKIWSATFSPTAGVSDASNTISVNLTGVRDQAGNAGVGSASSANFAIDLVRPSATVTLASSALKAGQSTTVTFRFSESVSDFTLEDIVLGNANGSLSALSANADGKTWTATFTPTVDVEDASNTISVNLTGVRDLAGNAGVGSASSANFSIDTMRPTATITLADSDLRAGESSTVSFSFSTPVTGFGLEDIDLSDANGALGALRAGADGKSWSATFTPTAAVQDAGNRISVNLAGVTNAAGNAGEGRASSANFAVNTRPSSTSSQAVEQAAPVTSATAPATPVSAGQQQAQSTADDDGTSRPTPEGLERPIQLSQTKQDAGRSEQFSLYVDLAQGVNGYWAKDHSGSWVNLASAAYGGKMEVQGERLRLDYRITDGGQFDTDGKADGSISAAGAAAYMPLAGQAADVQPGGV